MGDLDRRSFLGRISKIVSGSLGLTALGSNYNFEKVGESVEIKKKGTDPKNVVFILSDDHRYDFLSYLDTPGFLETPNMDRMASGGTHMENAYVTTSLCSPSRASILTGQYAHNHGVVDNQHNVPNDIVFFPEYLQDHGYDTAFVGKWHMGRSSAEPRPGFDRWVSFPGQGVYNNPELNIDGKTVERDGYISDIRTDYSVDWLKKKNKNRDQPFFLYLSHKAVHHPFKPAKRHKGRYDDVTLDLPENQLQKHENSPHWLKEAQKSTFGVPNILGGELDLPTLYRRYCETLLGVDESIGRVLDYLEKTGLDESTMVIYMGDNGFLLGEHGLIDKRNAYEESIRVPMLVQGPKGAETEPSISEMIQNIDIAPTVMDMAGLHAPANMDGDSFAPLLRGEDISWRSEILYEYYWEYHFPMEPTVFSLKTNRYKYIFNYGMWSKNELYDLKTDPKEMQNLIDKSKYSDKVKELRDRLFNKLKITGGREIQLKNPNRGWRLDKRKPKH